MARPSFSVVADVWRGNAPNPILRVGSQPRPAEPVSHPLRVQPPQPPQLPPPPRPAPSLVSHLLNKWPDKLVKASQQQFLSHAGCGTLSASALSHWLGQNSHVSRAMITFIGCLIGKIRLPETLQSKVNTQYRALDLLISTIGNLRKELDFMENTKRKYGLNGDGEPPTPITKAYMDLLSSASDSRSTLLEGMVALWSTEHCYYVSWKYASTFASAVPASNYSVPSYLTESAANTYGNGPDSVRAPSSSDQHVAALREALIPNWTSREFSKFVDACRAIADELANAETTGSGQEQLIRCESQYQQVVFLWERLWPEVDGMGQEPDVEKPDRSITSVEHTRPPQSTMAGPSAPNGATNPVTKVDPIEIDDDDEQEDDEEDDEDAAAESTDSPYAGTGLGPVAAANQTG